MRSDPFFEKLEPVGLTEIFKPVEPRAFYLPRPQLIIVTTKDCSYTPERVSSLVEIHWQNHRPWYAPWKKFVGFSVYCPFQLGLSGDMPIMAVLDRVLEGTPDACGKYRDLFYRLAKPLSVRISR
ncbi:hypothetical protein HKL94_00275 [Candidatus Parcubacteria bacterium]|nr:hypothetical protein [Candidatus Parcubacteria bacterium]